MKIAIAQLRCKPGDVTLNLAHAHAYAKQASEQGCDLIVLPEMVDTGYDTATLQQHASTWDEEPFRRFSAMAREHHLGIVTGLSEKTDDGLYNAVAVFDKAGQLISSYRKTHLITTEPICEQRVFSPGDSFCEFTFEGVKFGVMVCYDLRFPEQARHLALSGAQVILVPSAWPQARLDHWRALITCRAIENQLYMICANRVGIDGKLHFGGNSCVLDPWGEAEAIASEADEALLVSELNLERLEEIRKFIPVFKHRREDLYAKASLSASGSSSAQASRVEPNQ